MGPPEGHLKGSSCESLQKSGPPSEQDPGTSVAAIWVAAKELNPFLLIKPPQKIVNPVCRVLILGSPSKVVLASPAGEF